MEWGSSFDAAHIDGLLRKLSGENELLDAKSDIICGVFVRRMLIK
jgi:hypothetical protein